MSDEKRMLLAPKLRFPEFQSIDEWKFVPLNQLASRCKQKNRGEEINRVLTNSAEFGVLDQRDFFDKDIATQGKLETYSIVNLGDYVYNPRISTSAPVGPISKNEVGVGVMSPLYTVFRFANGENDFYQHYFKTAGWHSYMRQASSTGARHDRMAISGDGFMAMPLPISSPEEQQKIADCLSSLDELIAAQARKVDALKTHKKGLMQQLFPREGETQPRLRFPEFQNAGDWMPTTIGQLGEVVTGSTPSTSKPEYYGGDRLFVSPADISDDRYIDETKTFLTEEGFLETRSVKANSILFVCIGSTIGKIAQNRQECATNQQINSVVPNSENSDGFIYYALVGTADKIASIAGRQAVPIVNKSLFSSVGLKIPKLSEQRRIANFLSSLDDVILCESKKLEALRTYKKGLMQQLFPSIGESV